jgi:hypothetical protein
LTSSRVWANALTSCAGGLDRDLTTDFRVARGGAPTALDQSAMILSELIRAPRSVCSTWTSTAA